MNLGALLLQSLQAVCVRCGQLRRSRSSQLRKISHSSVIQDQEKSKSGAAAKSRVLEQLLPVIDNFEIAGKSIKTETEAEEKINESYQSLYRQTVDIFRNLGLEAVETVGVCSLPCVLMVGAN